ncbi:hypothetical protein FB451DRAFT_291896 [Mycena latifolia]|nr:hypothetical protein FB451DRAFT_291896 [Mycena latifolia]
MPSPFIASASPGPGHSDRAHDDPDSESEPFNVNAGKVYGWIQQMQEHLRNTQSELARLKSEIRRLEDVNGELVHQLALRNERLQACLPCHIARLPHEILLIIIRRALPPAWALKGGDTSLSPFPQSAWSMDLRMKLAIVGVSKTWHQIGLELLYESVILRRIGQLPAFVDALEARAGLGTLVRNISINCFVPHGYTSLHDEEIRRIFQLCPRLSHFGFKPPFRILPHTFLPKVSNTITSLEYNDRVEYSLIFPTLVQLSASLRSLALSLPSFDAVYPKLIFEKLEALRVRLSFVNGDAPPTWIMPALRRLWLHGGDYENPIRSPRNAELLLDSCGGTLTFLWLPAFMIILLDLASAPFSIQGLLDRCPALEHLAIPRLLCEVEPVLIHQRIHSLDIFRFPTRHTGALSSFLHGFTALRSVRTLDRTLALPWEVIPPGLPYEDETQREFGDQDSRSESAWITAMLATDPDSDDGDDSDYVFDVEAEDDGSVDDVDSGTDDSTDAAADTASEDEGGWGIYFDDFYGNEGERQVDRAEALAIFRGS